MEQVYSAARIPSSLKSAFFRPRVDPDQQRSVAKFVLQPFIDVLMLPIIRRRENKLAGRTADQILQNCPTSMPKLKHAYRQTCDSSRSCDVLAFASCAQNPEDFVGCKVETFAGDCLLWVLFHEPGA